MQASQRKKIKLIGYSTVMFIGLGIVGFILLLKSCLSQHDQRFKLSKAVVFENINGKDVVFTIIENCKTTSYEEDGGITRIQYNTTIWIQTHQVETGEVLGRKKICKINRVKNHPIELWGQFNNEAWCFINHLRAFDPVTLEETVNIKILEEINPELKDKFPQENRYYEPDIINGKILFTAVDGVKYQLSLSDRKCSRWSPDVDQSPLAMLDQEMKSISDRIDSNYASYRNGSAELSDGKISRKQFQSIYDQYNDARLRLGKQLDSLRSVKMILEANHRNWEDDQREIANLNHSSNYNLSQITISGDTVMGQYYALLSDHDKAEMSDYYRKSRNYSDTERNGFYKANMISGGRSKSDTKIDINGISRIGSHDFLQGGFLMDFNTASILRMSDPDGFIVLHRDEIGDHAHLEISRIDLNGTLVWGTRTTLPVRIQQLIETRKHLVIFASTNRGLASDVANTMAIVNLETGSNIEVDYMRRKEN